MITTRQIEKLFASCMYQKLLHQLLAMRPESSLRLEMELCQAIPAAAMAIIRLDELNQVHAAIYPELLRILLAAQEADGGWGDPLLTALCLRALLCCQGDGPAIQRGIVYLANLQRPDGLWPRVPIRRTDGDAFVSAFILFQLGQDDRFASAVQLNQAIAWFNQHADDLDGEAARLWQAASIRLRPAWRITALNHPATPAPFSPLADVAA